MAFASDFIWRKSVSWQLLNFNLFIFEYHFLMVDSNDNDLRLWNFTMKLFHVLDFNAES